MQPEEKPPKSGRKIFCKGIDGIIQTPLIELSQTSSGEDYYELPLKDINELIKLSRKNSLHESAVSFLSRLLTRFIVPHELNALYQDESPGLLGQVKQILSKKLNEFWKVKTDFNQFLSKKDFLKFCRDYFLLGNAYLLKVRSKDKRKIVKLIALNARLVRILKHKDGLQVGGYGLLIEGEIKKEFKPEDVIHICQPCSESDWYGLPNYLGAVNDISLAAAAKSQRVNHYANNGFTAGTLLMNIDPGEEDKDNPGTYPDEEAWFDIFDKTKEPGESRILCLNLRNKMQEVDDVSKVMHYVDLSQPLNGDDFKHTQSEARRSIYEAWQIPPELIGAVLDSKAATNQSKVMFNFYQNILSSHAEYIETGINQEIEDTKLWVAIRPHFKDDVENAGMKGNDLKGKGESDNVSKNQEGVWPTSSKQNAPAAAEPESSAPTPGTVSEY